MTVEEAQDNCRNDSELKPYQKQDKTIFNLKLHEILEIGSMRIRRVASGWIYETGYGIAVFVPFDNEFRKLKDEYFMERV